jgi:hypothetical protein
VRICLGWRAGESKAFGSLDGISVVLGHSWEQAETGIWDLITGKSTSLAQLDYMRVGKRAQRWNRLDTRILI